MKKGEKQTLIKSNVKINKKSEKLTKDEKKNWRIYANRFTLQCGNLRKFHIVKYQSVLLQMKFLRIISRIRILRHRAGESTICA